MIRKVLVIFFFVMYGIYVFPQSAPAAEENIPYLVTFGADSETSWGDDDFCQVFFFLIPKSHTDPVFIRVYDPDTGGALDEAKGAFNTVINFAVYGGEGAWSDQDAQDINLDGNYRSGNLLATKNFGSAPEYDQQYYSFGPFNPFEAENVDKFDGRIFKVIAQGVSGNDGNLYRYFLSTRPDENIEVEGANVFTYKYTFRLPNDQSQVSQIYPFVDDRTVSIEISNFDWDHDGMIRIISVAKNNVQNSVSGDDEWVVQKHPIVEEERNTTIEVQFVKNQKVKILNNNVVLMVRNQYGQSLPFFVSPIGGRPVYMPKIRMEGVQ